MPAGWGQSVRATLERSERLPGPHHGLMSIRPVYPSGWDGSRSVFYAQVDSDATVETDPFWAGSRRGANPAGDVILLVFWEADKDHVADPIDYTLTAEIGGELEDAPTYLIEPLRADTEPSELPTPSESPSPEPSPEPTTTAATPGAQAQESGGEEAGDSDGLAMTLAVVGGLLVLGGGAAAAVLLRRRR